MAVSFPRRRLLIFAAEFVLIVAGVLVALALDQWRARLNDRSRENAYVQRLRSDLINDTETFESFNQILDVKAEVLQELIQDPPLVNWEDDPVGHLRRLRYSTFIGLPPITSATFDELLSTGTLNLLRSFELRGQLSSYYSFYRRLTSILDQYAGDYRAAVWRSLPGEMEYTARQDSLKVDPVAFRHGLIRLRSYPQLREAVNYELTYTAALREYLWEGHRRAMALLGTIDQLYGF